MDHIIDAYEWGDPESHVDLLVDTWAMMVNVDMDQVDNKTRWELETGRKDIEDLPERMITDQMIAILAVPGPTNLLGNMDPSMAQYHVSNKHHSDMVEIEDLQGEARAVFEMFVN